MELSPDLISACLALEKYLDNPNALTERELVQWGPRPGRGVLLPHHPYTVFSLFAMSPVIVSGGPWSLGCVCVLESWALERDRGGGMGPKNDLPPANRALVSGPLGASGKELAYFPLLVSTLAFKGHTRNRDIHIFL